MRHGGSVMAPDAELAVHYAREMFGRRQESVRLWVVRRGDVLRPRRSRPAPAAARSVVQEAGRLRDARQAGRRARPVRPGQAQGAIVVTSAATRASAAPAPVALELAGLLASMADDEFVIGFSDSEWTGIAPLLEEDVAMSSIAQDELGHAAALYGLLGDLTGTDPDVLAYDREPDEYRHCRLLDHGRGDWAMTIARRFLYDIVRRRAARGAGRRRVGAAGRARRQAAARGALPPVARGHVAGAAGPERGRAARTPAGCARRARARTRGPSSRRSTARRHSWTPGSWPRR